MSAVAQATEAEPQAGHLALVVGRPGRVHLERARRHTKGSLRDLERAQRAHRRHHGLGPGPMPKELAAQLPCWSSRRNMLRLIDWLATQRYVQALCRAAEVAVETWRAIMINDVLDADSRTGRGVGTSQLVAGADVSRCEKQVQRARRVSVQLGIMVEYFRGYQLSGEQRCQLLEMSPGNEQKGIPNLYAMGVCPPRQRRRISVPRPAKYALVEANVHLPLCTYLGLPSYLPGPLPTAAAGASEATDGPPGRQPRRRRRPGMALAYEMLTLPALKLFTGVPAATLAGQLAPYHRGGWHGLELADALLQSAIAMRIDYSRPAHNPWAVLKTLLTQIEPIHDASGTAAPPPPKPCGRPDCDGHGWIQVSISLAEVAAAFVQAAADLSWTITRPPWKPTEVLKALLNPGQRDTWPSSVAKCPDCPPAIRASIPEEPW